MPPAGEHEPVPLQAADGSGELDDFALTDRDSERLVTARDLATHVENEGADAVTACVPITRRLRAARDAQATNENAVAASQANRACRGRPSDGERETRGDERKRRAERRHRTLPNSPEAYHRA